MSFSHSKRFGIRDTSAVVTLGKSSVTATCHARNSLFFNPYFFTVSLVTDNVNESIYREKNKNRGIGNIKFKFVYVGGYENTMCHGTRDTLRSFPAPLPFFNNQKGDYHE